MHTSKSKCWGLSELKSWSRCLVINLGPDMRAIAYFFCLIVERAKYVQNQLFHNDSNKITNIFSAHFVNFWF